MDMGEVVFDSSCVTQRVPPLRELWSRFPLLDAPPWLGARLHGTHIVSWHCQSRQVTVDVLLLPTLGHLARCLLPSPSFSLAKQMQANRQNTIFFFFFFLQVLCTRMAVALSSPSSPKSECMPTCSYSSPAAARSAATHRCNTGNCPIYSEWVEEGLGD